MYNCMFVSALPDPTCNSEKSANGGNKQILLNIIIIIWSQSLLGEHYCLLPVVLSFPVLRQWLFPTSMSSHFDYWYAFTSFYYSSKDFTYTRALFNLFRNVMNYRYLRKIVWTQFDSQKQKLPWK